MSSPAKRRKKDHPPSSSQSARSLEFFFGKQKEKQESVIEAESAEKQHDQKVPSQTHHRQPAVHIPLTDEQYARQIQDQWDYEERTPLSSQVTSKTDQVLRQYTRPFDSAFEPAAPLEVNSETQISPDVQGADVEGKKATLSLQSAATTEDIITATVPFDENPLSFDPSKFLPGLKAQWRDLKGHSSYGLLTRCFILVNSTQSRIKIVDTLVNLLRTIIEGDPDSLLAAVGVEEIVPVAAALAD